MQPSLSVRCKEIILGSLLGDGSLKIHKPYINARFSFRHSINQSDYFYWKVHELKEISSEHYVWRQKADGFGGEKIRYQSRALESLTEIYHLTHARGEFRVTNEWLQKLTPLSLAIWWLDDGSLIANTRKGVLCTDGFAHDEVTRLAYYLFHRWHIRTHVRAIKTNQYRIWLDSSEELKKFLRLIVPVIPVSSVLSKLILLYKNPLLQQRWISEIHDHSSFSNKIINDSVRNKRNKWRAFRE